MPQPLGVERPRINALVPDGAALWLASAEDGLFRVEGDKVTLTGTVASQEEKEKIILAAGNIAGVASVDDQITVTGPVVAAARFVVVKKGDTLSAISLAVYGKASRYNDIFEANKPLLSHPDKIYPGQTLRIPE